MNVKERAAEISKMLQELYDEANSTGEKFSIVFNGAYYNKYESTYEDGKVGFDFSYRESIHNDDSKVMLIDRPDYGWYSSSCSW